MWGAYDYPVLVCTRTRFRISHRLGAVVHAGVCLVCSASVCRILIKLCTQANTPHKADIRRRFNEALCARLGFTPGCGRGARVREPRARRG